MDLGGGYCSLGHVMADVAPLVNVQSIIPLEASWDCFLLGKAIRQVFRVKTREHGSDTAKQEALMADVSSVNRGSQSKEAWYTSVDTKTVFEYR